MLPRGCQSILRDGPSAQTTRDRPRIEGERREIAGGTRPVSTTRFHLGLAHRRDDRRERTDNSRDNSPRKPRVNQPERPLISSLRKSGFKARRWVVERTHSWMNRFRRILIRWEKKVENYFGMLHLVCAFITYRCSGLLG